MSGARGREASWSPVVLYRFPLVSQIQVAKPPGAPVQLPCPFLILDVFHPRGLEEPEEAGTAVDSSRVFPETVD